MIKIVYKGISDIFCDKFSATIQIDSDQQAYVKQQLRFLAKKHIAQPTYRGSYQHSYLLYLNKSGSERMGFQCDPRRGSYSFARIELNPSKLKMSSVRQVLDFILPNKYETLLENGIVTRLDVTVDIKNVALDDLLIWSVPIR